MMLRLLFLPVDLFDDVLLCTSFCNHVYLALLLRCRKGQLLQNLS